MKRFLTWPAVIGGLVVGVTLASAFVLALDQTVKLSGLDLFFAITAVLSLGVNLWQLVRDRYRHAPLIDALIGLFNDLKARQQRGYQRQQLITSQAGQQQQVEAVRLEFYDFVQETMLGLEQLREHVVAAIHALDPDVTTQQVFRAAEFGLTEQERKFRVDDAERFRRKWVESQDRQQGSEAGSQATKPPAE